MAMDFETAVGVYRTDGVEVQIIPFVR
jgi:hypothetical protein